MTEHPFERSLSELCNMADERDSKAYAALCGQELSNADFRKALLKIINEGK